MLGYSIRGSLNPNSVPTIKVTQGWSVTQISSSHPADDSYWIAILDANNPANKIQEFNVPGANNTAIPAGLDAYMRNPAYLFALVTQTLQCAHVPQGAFYDYLVSYGAGRELQKLEQINTSFGCGQFSTLSYALTGQCGPPNSGSPAYEQGSGSGSVLLMLSFMPLPSGQPPYSLCDSYTFGNKAQSVGAGS
jgi:hypothetical protein